MNESLVLAATAAMVAATHTLIPDHWLPYVAMSRAKGWSIRKAMWVTGIGAAIHLVSTAILGVLLGFIGASAITGISEKADLISGFLLLMFGLYFTWKGWKAYKLGQVHSHAGHSYPHPHRHKAGHDHNCRHGRYHSHGEKVEKSAFALSAILGARPCAEAIPIFLSASTLGLTSSFLAVTAWVITTLASMLGIVWLSLKGLESSKLKVLHRFGELGAGLIIVFIGIAMMLFGV